MPGNPDPTSPAGQKPAALGSVENLPLFRKLEGSGGLFWGGRAPRGNHMAYLADGAKANRPGSVLIGGGSDPAVKKFPKGTAEVFHEA